MKSKEEMWWEAFLVERKSSTVSFAVDAADASVAAYTERWPEAVLAESIGSPVDLHLLQRVASQLDASGRRDAHLVVKALYEAIKVAISKGEQLTMWNPPPRGG